MGRERVSRGQTAVVLWSAAFARWSAWQAAVCELGALFL